MSERALTRAQNTLRSFFGLGVEQISVLDLIIPTIDIGHLLASYQEQQIITAITGAVIPGAAEAIALPPPRNGIWLVDWIGFETPGPTTSGSGTFTCAVQTVRAGITEQFSIFDSQPRLTRMAGGTFYCGRKFDPPALLWRTPTFSDEILLTVFNEAASVGNMTTQLTALVRQLELTKE